MATLILIIQLIAGIAGSLAALISIVLFLRFRWPAAAMWGLKVCASAVSSVFMLVGLLTLVAGVATNSIFICAIGIYVTLIYFVHFLVVTRTPADGFKRVFGTKWKNQLNFGRL